MSALPTSCTCLSCPGPSCTCGCRNRATVLRAAGSCSDACRCGPACRCQAA